MADNESGGSYACRVGSFAGFGGDWFVLIEKISHGTGAKNAVPWDIFLKP